MDVKKLKYQLNEFESLLHEESNGDNNKQMMLEGNVISGELQLVIYINGERHLNYSFWHMEEAVRIFNGLKYE